MNLRMSTNGRFFNVNVPISNHIVSNAVYPLDDALTARLYGHSELRNQKEHTIL